MTENEIGTIIVDTAIEVHRQLGPGLLESVYEAILAYELAARGLHVERQVRIHILASLPEHFRSHGKPRSSTKAPGRLLRKCNKVPPS